MDLDAHDWGTPLLFKDCPALMKLWEVFEFRHLLGLQEPVIAPPIHLLRMTAATLKSGIGRWKPVSVSGRPRPNHQPTNPILCWPLDAIARCPLKDGATFHLDILVADGAPSNNMLKKAEAALWQKS